MNTKLTFKPFALSIFIAIATIFSSCSISNQLSSKSPHYHLNLVKANNYPLPSDKKGTENTASDIAPLSHHTSLVSYQSDEQLNEITGLLKTDMKLLTKEAKKTSPGVYQQIKAVNLPKTLHQLTTGISKDNKLSVNNTNEWNGGAGRYFGLFILFLLLALLFWILSLGGGGLLGLLGLISSIAAVIFFILWIVALAS